MQTPNKSVRIINGMDRICKVDKRLIIPENRCGKKYWYKHDTSITNQNIRRLKIKVHDWDFRII
jgi:hypothetical protein